MMDHPPSLFRTIGIAAAPLLGGVLLAALPILSQSAYADAPTCQGQTATIYVESGMIVGGPDDSLAYAGTLRGTGSGDVIMGTSGNDTLVGNGGADSICGGGGTDTFQGSDSDSTWTVNGDTVTYFDGTNTSTITGIANLVGGTGNDTFTVTADHTGNLSGGDGNDVFHLLNAATVSGMADGGSGSDTLTYDGYTTGVSITLGRYGAAVTDGYSGFATGITGGFKSVDSLVGSSGQDSLKGEQTNNLWMIDATDTYNDGAVANNLALSGFESLIGAAANDQFLIKNDTAFTGSIDGGVGTDTVTFDSSNSVGRTVLVSGTNAGSVSGAFSFASIENLAGGSGDDTFQFTSNGAQVTGSINGGGGTNALVYSGYTSSVRVNLAAGTATGTSSISNIRNVTGGVGNDILLGDGSANVLSGSAGNDILVGQGGTDTLNGGNGNDILLGGLGSDSLDSSADDDILIGGTTSYDSNIAALNAIMAEWSRTGVAYATRVAHIFGSQSGGLNGSYRFNATTVSNDANAADSLTGGTGNDWFLASTGDTTDQGGSEILTNI